VIVSDHVGKVLLIAGLADAGTAGRQNERSL